MDQLGLPIERGYNRHANPICSTYQKKRDGLLERFAMINKTMFTVDEKFAITKYGYWFEAIRACKIPLTTEKLKLFKRAKEMNTAERNKWENLWVHYNRERCPF